MSARAIVVACCCVAGAWTFRIKYHNRPLPEGFHNGDPMYYSNAGPVGDPLFLTPFIEDGQVDLAKSLAFVGPINGDNVPSYAGYLTVNKTTESNMFFWFFPALNNAGKAPTLLWLEGGPGGSALFGLFVEHGPYEITARQLARHRNTTWAKQFNMLYIDNPVGTGYSFTKDDRGYVTNQSEVGRDLFEALQQFFTLFKEFAPNDFYITGESYAGKYVPAAAYTIHQNRDKAKMRLAGVVIGDGWCDPITMLDFASFLRQIGLADERLATRLRVMQDKVKSLINLDDFIGANSAIDEITDLIQTANGLHVLSNFLLTKQHSSFEYYNTFVQTTQTRRAIHVGNLTYNDGDTVYNKLVGDIMRSVKPWIAEILNNNYKVLIYNGQLDVIVPGPLTESFVNSIQWNGASDLARAKRAIWRNPRTGDPAGYVRQVNNFTQVLVRNAGHILPFDQPENAYDMIDRFINNKPFN